MIKKNKKYLFIYIYLLSLLLFFIFILFLYNKQFYYVESSSWNIKSKLNSSDMYKNYCLNWEWIWICNIINSNFFNSYFYGECKAVYYNDSEYCNLLTNDEDRRFCKNNIILYNAIIKSDIDNCNLLTETNYWVYDNNWNKIKTNEFNELWHNDKSNFDFCIEAVNLSKSKNINDISKFVLDFFWEDRFSSRVFWLILQDSNYCFESSWIDDKIKCLIYTKELDCDSLINKDYIYKLINNTNHFYDIWKDGF